MIINILLAIGGIALMIAIIYFTVFGFLFVVHAANNTYLHPEFTFEETWKDFNDMMDDRGIYENKNQ
jgi:hypothetical protein